jgi:hypothetical protein
MRVLCVALVVGPLACSLGPVIDVPFQDPDRSPPEGSDDSLGAPADDGGLVSGDGPSGAGGPVAASGGGSADGGAAAVGGSVAASGGSESLGGAAGSVQTP